MSFPNKNQSVQCDVRSCKHHTNDGMCELDVIKVAPRGNCHTAPVTKANAPAITPGKGLRKRRAERSLPLRLFASVHSDARQFFPRIANGVLVLHTVIWIVLLALVHIAQEMHAVLAVEIVARNGLAAMRHIMGGSDGPPAVRQFDIHDLGTPAFLVAKGLEHRPRYPPR